VRGWDELEPGARASPEPPVGLASPVPASSRAARACRSEPGARLARAPETAGLQLGALRPRGEGLKRTGLRVMRACRRRAGRRTTGRSGIGLAILDLAPPGAFPTGPPQIARGQHKCMHVPKMHFKLLVARAADNLTSHRLLRGLRDCEGRPGTAAQAWARLVARDRRARAFRSLLASLAQPNRSLQQTGHRPCSMNCADGRSLTVDCESSLNVANFLMHVSAARITPLQAMACSSGAQARRGRSHDCARPNAAGLLATAQPATASILIPSSGHL